jgi:signal transduction histidine kinase
MKPGAIPPDEEDRLARLNSYAILDTLDEKEYDDIARLVAQICETPMANISFVDSERQWFKAVVGLKDRETSRDVAFCGHTILGEELFTVEDATEDERFHDNPLVTEDPRIRFYAGMPLVTPDGHKLGALCAIDSKPRRLNETQRNALEVLSRHVVDLLELRMRNRQLTVISELKTRLLAIIGHDLRSPIAKLSSAISLLNEGKLSEEIIGDVLSEMNETMAGAQSLLDNLMSWAARQMDGVSPKEPVDLGVVVKGVAEGMRSEISKKNNTLNLDLPTMPTLQVDRGVVEFILRNFLANALKFTKDGEITVSGHVEENGVSIAVSDTGVGMNEDHVKRLFDWESRRKTRGTNNEEGSGVALLLCKDMADRIGGDINVQSRVGRGTTITLVLGTESVPV